MYAVYYKAYFNISRFVIDMCEFLYVLLVFYIVYSIRILLLAHIYMHRIDIMVKQITCPMMNFFRIPILSIATLEKHLYEVKVNLI